MGAVAPREKQGREAQKGGTVIEREANHKKIYGRGFHDGKAAAEKEMKEKSNMNAKRFNSIMAGLTGMPRKVYEAIPIAEQWQEHKILLELSRAGIQIDTRSLQHCINSLIGQGLVFGNSKDGYFKEAPPEPKQKIEGPSREALIVPIIKPAEAPPAAPDEACAGDAEKQSPIDIMADLEEHVTNAINALNDLRDGLVSASVAIEERFAECESRSAKLAQLQQLLKGL